MTEAGTDYGDWIGKRETKSDTVTLAPVAGLIATLDRDDPAPKPGDALPPLWHWLYFLPRERRSELGPDGHAARGGFIPPIDLPHRMWAGGRFTFHQTLRIGDEVERQAEIINVQEKQGRSGPLVFVTVRFRFSTERGLCVEEEKDIVYRGPSPKGAAPQKAGPADPPFEADWTQTVEADPVLLFRYSALTFNGHRIHYDHPYTTGEEGYPGLIVHGPLVATLLIDLCRDRAADKSIRSYSFRAVRPLFDTAPFSLQGRLEGDGNSCQLAALTPDAQTALQAEAVFS